MNYTPLYIVAEYGECNGFMSLDWYMDDLFLCHTPAPKLENTTTASEIELQLQLPCLLKVIVSGKNLNLDTRMENGTIVNDKYFSIKSMSLGHYPINIGVLNSTLCQFTPHGEAQRSTTYFHANGAATFNFCENDVLLWHLKHNHYHEL